MGYIHIYLSESQLSKVKMTAGVSTSNIHDKSTRLKCESVVSL